MVAYRTAHAQRISWDFPGSFPSLPAVDVPPHSLHANIRYGAYTTNCTVMCIKRVHACSRIIVSGTDMSLFVLFCCLYLYLALPCAARDINADDQNHGKSRDGPLMLIKQTQSGACFILKLYPFMYSWSNILVKQV